MPQGPAPARIAASGCLTAFGDERASLAALLRGESALKPVPYLGREGGDLVPLALLNDRALDEEVEPVWLPALRQMLAPVQDRKWGTPRRPVFVTSSNFGVGGLYAFRRSGEERFNTWGSTPNCVEWLREKMNWGRNVMVFSHACVSAHIGLLQASRAIEAGHVDEALVFSFDMLSPFVAGGFHALKILNSDMPAPYMDRPTSAIALGDGAAWAVVSRDSAEFQLEAQALHNEMFHFTANAPDGSGFRALLAQLTPKLAGRRLWLKGHGTGTLEAGKLESTALAEAFPAAPLVGWKGALGHTLGSCGLVEMCIAMEALRTGRTPGTIGTTSPTFSTEVATAAFDNRAYDGVLCLSNAFGGAHAAFLLSHA